jgi:cbb3-type cytochrome oxidase subunit 3
LFFTFFVGVTIFVYKTPKKEMQNLGHIPLEQ